MSTGQNEGTADGVKELYREKKKKKKKKKKENQETKEFILFGTYTTGIVTYTLL